MGTTRTAWHVLLAALLGQRGPRRFEVRREVPLSSEPLRADDLLLQSVGDTDDPPGTLRKLWPLLPTDTILEFKSVGRPYRSRNLDRLWAYLHLYYADQPERLKQRADLCGALLVPTRTSSLDADAKAMGLAWLDLGDGYWKLTGGMFALHVAEIDVVAEAEDDDLLRSLGHAGPETAEGRRWLMEQTWAKELTMEMQDLEGYDEIMEKIAATLSPEQRMAGLTPEQRLTGLAPEQRLSGLAPEQRLAGLAPEEQLLALSDEVLRGLPEAYLATLSGPTRAKIRARIGR
jgi:hypothetical protein